MRVLPFVGTACPRRPLEKSYSAFIVSPLLRGRPSNRDEALAVDTLGPDPTISSPAAFIPSVIQRCSPSEESPSIVRPSGSFNTPSPSTRERPCLAMLAASLSGSNFEPTYVPYMHVVHTSRA